MKNEPPGNVYVYILECADRTLYTGRTTNVEKRIREHNSSRAGARYTRGRRPVRLIYVEVCSSLSAALGREAEIKRLSRVRKLRLINGEPGLDDV
jgi:putative endonuclease